MTDRLRIGFRVDASRRIGGGHVMRCLALANALRDRGADTVFLSRIMDGDLTARTASDGHRVIALAPASSPFSPAFGDPRHASWAGISWQRDAEEAVAGLMHVDGVDWLIMDHYSFDARWVNAVRPAARRVLVIDDLDDRLLDCDLPVDPSRLEPAPRRHGGRDNLIGPRFALLRPELAARRPAALARRRRRHPVRTVLISTGMMDVGRLALLTAHALRDTKFLVTVAVGARAPTMAELQRIESEARNVTVRVSAIAMANLMAAADLAIGSGGTTTWERCCLSLP